MCRFDDGKERSVSFIRKKSSLCGNKHLVLCLLEEGDGSLCSGDRNLSHSVLLLTNSDILINKCFNNPSHESQGAFPCFEPYWLWLLLQDRCYLPSGTEAVCFWMGCIAITVNNVLQHRNSILKVLNGLAQDGLCHASIFVRSLLTKTRYLVTISETWLNPIGQIGLCLDACRQSFLEGRRWLMPLWGNLRQLPWLPKLITLSSVYKQMFWKSFKISYPPNLFISHHHFSLFPCNNSDSACF